MKKTQFEKPFQISTRSLDEAAVIYAAGYYVQALKQAATHRRCIFYFDDCTETRDLLTKFEAREALPISAKELLQSRTELHHMALKAITEAL